MHRHVLQKLWLLWIISFEFWAMFPPLSMLSIFMRTWFVSATCSVGVLAVYVACAFSCCSMCACLVFHLLDFKSMFLDLRSTLQCWDDLSSLAGYVRCRCISCQNSCADKKTDLLMGAPLFISGHGMQAYTFSLRLKLRGIPEPEPPMGTVWKI